jgi:Ca2+-binding RTX toxin-like protein
MSTVTLTGNYGYRDYRLDRSTVDVVDASSASWTLANSGSTLNLYPFQVTNTEADIRIIGGTINGQVSLTGDWANIYVNSAAVRVAGTRDAVIEDWRISRVWDGIRINGNSDGFHIDNVWLSDVRDDAVENDNGASGRITNSLFDGVFVGVSTADRGNTDHSRSTVTLDNVLIRMESYLFKGSVTHQAPFKIYDNSPRMEIHDSVFAIENVNHRGKNLLDTAWDKTIDASGNYFLNLSDTPLPRDYPMPPSGFTVLQGAQARAFWENARSEWIADHGSGTSTVTHSSSISAPAPTTTTVSQQTTVATDTSTGTPTHVGTDAADNLRGASGNDVMLGRGGNDVIAGNNGNDVIRGQAGDDRLIGGSGTDIMIGGTGNDSFRFTSVNDSPWGRPDIIRAGDGAIAFEGAGAARGDIFDFRAIDANTSVADDQAFVFGSTGRGGISVVDVGGNTMIRGNIDSDPEFEFAIIIEDGAVPASAYTANDFML